MGGSVTDHSAAAVEGYSPGDAAFPCVATLFESARGSLFDYRPSCKGREVTLVTGESYALR